MNILDSRTLERIADACEATQRVIERVLEKKQPPQLVAIDEGSVADKLFERVNELQRAVDLHNKLASERLAHIRELEKAQALHDVELAEARARCDYCGGKLDRDAARKLRELIDSAREYTFGRIHVDALERALEWERRT